ncbi:hypothetical protein GUJ93_ZPchr0001g32825 [Zizania palustris]|uniref:Uncharacterized protein n=1 Tax=Zizania palustris TaxID=103762 RepID=A0A8J5VLB3_ZIZPA|nr:hypothetical protein GUJ93_ZPchr0001g32825 [Zizania palustris]
MAVLDPAVAKGARPPVVASSPKGGGTPERREEGGGGALGRREEEADGVVKVKTGLLLGFSFSYEELEGYC